MKVPVYHGKESGGGQYDVPLEADILMWVKKEGGEVKEGDELCVLEVDKGEYSIHATTSGRVVDIQYPVGKTWIRGALIEGTRCYGPPLCFIESEDSELSTKNEENEQKPEAAEEKREKPKISPRAWRKIQEEKINVAKLVEHFPDVLRIEESHVEEFLGARTKVHEAEVQPPKNEEKLVDGGLLRAVPLARKLARDLDLDLNKITGSGPDGTVLAADISRVRKDEEEEPVFLTMPRAWRTIAENMEAGAEIPTADAEAELFNFAPLWSFAELHKRAFPYARWFPLVASIVRVLQREEFILFNSYWHENGGEKFVAARKYVHMGLSYDRGDPPQIDWAAKRVSGERLKILTIRHAEKHTLDGLVAEVVRLIRAAAEKTLTMEEMTGYTFIFNNIGALSHARGRSLFSKSAQSRIGSMANLGMIRPDFSGALQVVFDHRLIDGAMTKAFIRAIEGEMNERVLPELVHIFSSDAVRKE